MKLQTKLLVLYALSALFILASLGGGLYWSLWGLSLRSIQSTVSNELQHVDFALNTFFNGVIYDINALAINGAVRTRDDSQFTTFLNANEDTFTYRIGGSEQKIINIFNNYRLTHPHVNSVYMGRENGSFVRSHKRARPTPYDPRERPWYTLAKRNPWRVVLTDAYPSVTTPDVNIGIVKALIDTNDVFYGVVGIDVTLVQITNYIAHFKTSSLARVLLIDEHGVILAGSPRDILFKTVDAYAPGLTRILTDPEAGFFSVAIRDKQYYVFSISATGHNWKIASLIPASTIRKQIIGQIAMTGSGLLIGLILLSILTLIGLRMYVVKPLKRFTDETNYITRTSDLEHRVDIASHDEIGLLADSYNQMMDTLSRAEGELRRSEKQYRDIFNNAVMGIYQSTPEGRWLNVNPTMATMFGFKTPEEMVSSVTDIQHEFYVRPEERDRFKKIFEEEDVLRGFEAEFKRRDGSRFWISIHGKAIRDEDGKILYYEGTIDDITERKQAERELAKYRGHLETLVRERTEELEIAKERAESADRLKSAFLATMSHELRTPLNSIIGFTGIILQEIVGPLSDEQKKQLGMVKSSAQHLLSLINDVLDISKIEAGQLQVIHEPYDLRQTIEKAVGSARPLAEKKGLDLICTISPETETVAGDPRRVEQILLNLISNAIKFTEKGSVTVACEPEGEDITIRVADTGIGIKDEDMETIFQPFRQIDSGMTRKYEGTGLGLSICKKLVELMGGTIWMTSEWGSGSTFGFSLPRERNGE